MIVCIVYNGQSVRIFKNMECIRVLLISSNSKKILFFFVFPSKVAILRMFVLETLSRVKKKAYIAKEIVVFMAFATVKVR